jgi:hypothetical protein
MAALSRLITRSGFQDLRDPIELVEMGLLREAVSAAPSASSLSTLRLTRRTGTCSCKLRDQVATHVATRIAQCGRSMMRARRFLAGESSRRSRTGKLRWHLVQRARPWLWLLVMVSTAARVFQLAAESIPVSVGPGGWSATPGNSSQTHRARPPTPSAWTGQGSRLAGPALGRTCARASGCRRSPVSHGWFRS